MNGLTGTKKTTTGTTSTRHNPFVSLQHELDKAMTDFYGLFDRNKLVKENFENFLIVPAIDLVEDKDTLKIEVEMPGMGEEDVKVSIDNGILTIKGEKTTSRKDKEKNYLSREISYGSYERSIALPDTVDTTKAKASFKKGMLWVTLPKKPECTKECRDIPVERVEE